MINNYILGQIGVVEGNAVNRADYPISRIQIKGEIVDAYSVVLGEHTSYAGNILTDEELNQFIRRRNFNETSPIRRASIIPMIKLCPMDKYLS